MSKVCPNCNMVIAKDEAKFCPNCGNNLVSVQQTPPLQQEQGNLQPSNDVFNGTSSDNFWGKVKNKNYIITLLVTLFVVAFGSYMYFSGIQEDKYLLQYAEVSRSLNTTNETLVNDISKEKLKNDQLKNIKEDLELQKKIVDDMAKNFSDNKPLSKYDKQHKDTIELLQKESVLISNIIAAIDNPLDANNDAALGALQESIDTLKSLSNDIVIPNTTLVTNADLSGIVSPLNAYVNEQRRINKQKMERLQAMQKFFWAMDSYIQNYNSARDEYDKMLETGRTGAGMIWSDYFNALYKAKSDRQDIRKKVNDLAAPAGAEPLKNKLLNVLDKSITCCELMRIGGNLRFNNYYADGTSKENEALRLNKDVQSMYEEFLSTYSSEKNRLTNINNL